MYCGHSVQYAVKTHQAESPRLMQGAEELTAKCRKLLRRDGEGGAEVICPAEEAAEAATTQKGKEPAAGQ